MAGFENSLRAASRAILKRDLTESERVEFLELAGAIGMNNVEDYLYMLMVFKRNEDRVDSTLAEFRDEMKARFDEVAAMEQSIRSTLENSISRVLGVGAREIGRDMGDEWVFRENGPRAREKRSTLPRKMVRRYAAAVH
jgi:hypothetical protein